MCLVHRKAGSICRCELKMACCNLPLQSSGQRDGMCQHGEGAVCVCELPAEGLRAAESRPDMAVAVRSLPLL